MARVLGEKAPHLLGFRQHFSAQPCGWVGFCKFVLGRWNAYSLCFQVHRPWLYLSCPLSLVEAWEHYLPTMISLLCHLTFFWPTSLCFPCKWPDFYGWMTWTFFSLFGKVSISLRSSPSFLLSQDGRPQGRLHPLLQRSSSDPDAPPGIFPVHCVEGQMLGCWVRALPCPLPAPCYHGALLPLISVPFPLRLLSSSQASSISAFPFLAHVSSFTFFHFYFSRNNNAHFPLSPSPKRNCLFLNLVCKFFDVKKLVYWIHVAKISSKAHTQITMNKCIAGQ